MPFKPRGIEAMNMIPRHADSTLTARITPPSGPFLQLHSGYCVSLTSPDCTGLPLSDIAIALARTARFRGATRGAYAYSVAQHSWLVSTILAEQHHTQTIQRAGLLHDAHEALLGDIPTPVKHYLGAEFITVMERPLILALHARFNLAASLCHSWQVKQADELALATERRDLLAPSAWAWESPCAPAPHHNIVPWPESQAYAAFMRHAHRLGLR
jgi:uncharacterized protein